VFDSSSSPRRGSRVFAWVARLLGRLESRFVLSVAIIVSLLPFDWVPRLDGKVSARYRRVPERLEAIQGWFELREGANVELHAEGRLEHGGEATVDAQVMHGDLISVRVRAERVPVSEHLIAAMPGQSKLMIEPFRLEGGEIDVAILFSTDGTIADKGWVVLNDDMGLINADNIIPIGTQELIDVYGDALRAVVDAVSAALTTAGLTELNRQVGIDLEDPDAVAQAWLESEGLLN